MRVLAIDPGYGRAGFAVIDGGVKQHTLVVSECLETGADEIFEERLHAVGSRVSELIETYGPDCVVIEGLFFAKNKKTALQVAEIRGCCLFVAKQHKLPVYEYTPNQIKSAVVGDGGASKTAILQMLKHFLEIPDSKNRHDDEFDAIAVGVTHLSSNQQLWG